MPIQAQNFISAVNAYANAAKGNASFDGKESDNLRESLKKKGWVVVDGEAGYSLEKL